MATEFDELRWKTHRQKVVYRHTAALTLLPASTTSVLDVGCGDGLWLGLAHDARPGIECTGVDFSQNAVDAATSNHPKCRFFRADAINDALPFRDGSFDTVVALDVLEHVFQPHRLLREMHRVARRDVIIGVPNFSSLPARIQTVIGRVPENNNPRKGHVYWFRLRDLRALVTQVGFEIEAVGWNHQLAGVPVAGRLMKALADLRPSLFALSFVLRAKKVH